MEWYLEKLRDINGSEVVKSLVKDFQIRDDLDRLKEFDELTYLHSVRVGILLYGLAKVFDLKPVVALAGLMHDVGKMGVSKSLLVKDSKLTCEEMEELKQHTLLGYEMVVEKKLPSVVAEATKYHHIFQEKGYPKSLEDVDLKFKREVEVVALADKYDSLVSDRPYKSSLSHKKAISILAKEFRGDKKLVRGLDSFFKR